MHILFLTDNFYPEGNATASRVYERACYWVKWGHQVTVITSVPNFPAGKVFEGYKNKWYQSEIIDGIRVVRVKTFIYPNKGKILRILDFLSYVVPAFFAGLFIKKPDVVVVTTPQFFVTLSGYLLSIVKRRPYVIEVGDLWPAFISAVGITIKSPILWCLEKFELFMYHRASSIVVLTSAFKKNLVLRHIEAKKIHVVINGVEFSKYQPQTRELSLMRQYDLSDRFIVGYVGNHGMAQDLQNVLYAATLLQKDYPSICFMFVGDGAERQNLMAFAERERLSNVRFVPMQPKNKIAAFWALSHVALVQLKDDPLFGTVIPSKIFEAMAMQLPILLVAPKGEASAIIEENQNGIHVEAGQPQLLADTVVKLYDDSHLLQQCANNSAHNISKYSREAQARKFLEILNVTVCSKNA